MLLCTGKIGWQLIEARDERNAPVAVVRVEQLYPFPKDQILDILARYPNATEIKWVQEEPENMGAWTFIYRHLSRALPDRFSLDYVARPESASPATGSARVHQQEQQELIERSFAEGAEGEQPGSAGEQVRREQEHTPDAEAS